MVNTVRKKDVWEALNHVAKGRTRADKIKRLAEFESDMPVRDVLQGAFDERIQWNIPSGTPPYTPQVEGPPPPTTLLREHLKFKYFVKGLRESEDLLSVRRERMFIDMLESVDPRDAELLVNMINKKPPVKGLTEAIVKEALPDLIP